MACQEREFRTDNLPLQPSWTVQLVEAATQRRISNALTLTQQLGGTPFQFKGSDIISAIAAFAQELGGEWVSLQAG